MGKYVVIWQQEMKDGELGTLDTTFDTIEEVEKHIKYLEEAVSYTHLTLPTN